MDSSYVKGFILGGFTGLIIGFVTDQPINKLLGCALISGGITSLSVSYIVEGEIKDHENRTQER